jgi:hypothetical protein
MTKEQRTNSAKWGAILVTLALAVGGWIWNLSNQSARLLAAEKEITRITPLEQSTIEMKKDIQYIRSGIDELKQNLKDRMYEGKGK